MLQAAVRRAQQSVSEERLHSWSSTNPIVTGAIGNSVRDPDPGQQASGSLGAAADPLEIWRILPALSQLPESVLKQLPRSEIFQLNAALVQESKAAAKIQANAKLLLNAQQLEKNPVKVEAGWDDRKRMLHPARFLGGASCSSQQLWLQAREVLGPHGVLPLGNYDLDAVGYGGCVTPRGWTVLHDPSSGDLKLKLFYLPNVGSSSLSSRKISLEDNDNAINVGESLKEISDMEAFKSALNTLREAMASALPWNRSVGAICGFLSNTNYCATDLAQNSKKAVILTEFVDYALSRNALNWENGQPFLSADDLSHTWSTWKTKRVAAVTQQGAKAKKEQKKERDDICRKFNTQAGCPYAEADCKTFYGNKLRHVCSFVMPNGKKCEKQHPKPEHT
jgi:hypothetical protein